MCVVVQFLLRSLTNITLTRLVPIRIGAVPCYAWSVITFHLPLDLPEARKIAGIVGCPDCERLAGDDAEDTIPRTTAGTLTAIEDAMAFLADGGGVTVARRMLASHGLARTHLEGDCPLMSLPQFCLSCLPGDRLHLAYVRNCSTCSPWHGTLVWLCMRDFACMCVHPYCACSARAYNSCVCVCRA